MKKCMTKGCKREAKTRGLCAACYEAARKAGDASRLVELGLILPAHPPRSPFSKALAQKLGK